MNEKLCLGTVQFGLQYGINNVLDRKPDVDECFDILDYAISMGIGCFDTASVYGNAEQIIGSYKGFNDNVKIISKLRPMLNDSDLSQDSIVQECENTLKRLDKKLYMATYFITLRICIMTRFWQDCISVKKVD